MTNFTKRIDIVCRITLSTEHLIDIPNSGRCEAKKLYWSKSWNYFVCLLNLLWSMVSDLYIGLFGLL